MAGFRFAYTLHGNPPETSKILAKDTETITFGDMLNLETGEVDLAAAADIAFVGAALATYSAVDSTTEIECICDPEAVYSVTDANARLEGALLDINATSDGVTTASENNFVVVKTKAAASDATLVKIADTHHYMRVN